MLSKTVNPIQTDGVWYQNIVRFISSQQVPFRLYVCCAWVLYWILRTCSMLRKKHLPVKYNFDVPLYYPQSYLMLRVIHAQWMRDGATAPFSAIAGWQVCSEPDQYIKWCFVQIPDIHFSLVVDVTTDAAAVRAATTAAAFSSVAALSFTPYPCPSSIYVRIFLLTEGGKPRTQSLF